MKEKIEKLIEKYEDLIRVKEADLKSYESHRLVHGLIQNEIEDYKIFVTELQSLLK